MAGSWCKDEVECANALPINKLASWSKGLQPGYGGTVRWSIGGRETSSIGYSVLSEHAVLLSYRQGGQEVGYSVAITYSWLVSGGRRPWWRCPACTRRCGVIYGCRRGGRYFVCRRCGDLAYASQHTRDRKGDGIVEFMARTRWGRALLAATEAEMEAEHVRQETEIRAMVRAAAGEEPLPKRGRGRPRTKRKYTRRQSSGL